ncbi:TIR domain-containing protein [Paraburkholderia sp. RL17-381-BIF-C]|uniref:TIR domain-containing protein n=1 Tax=Paraburkholderia sp. RL17-381-BIF-C TaxID=3031635 RepID=UPI0038B947A6
MKIFISWSGDRSRYIAEALREWLPKVMQTVKPWMSDADIFAGSRWLNEVSSELATTNFGLLCVTPENQSNAWLLFEAGALSKALNEASVCPLLYEMAPSQLSGPLAQFQANPLTRDGMRRIVTTINRALQVGELAQADLDESFDVWWPRLEARLASTPVADQKVPAARSTDEILDELVTNTREQIRRENLRLEWQQTRDKEMDEMTNVMKGFAQIMQSASVMLSPGSQGLGSPGMLAGDIFEHKDTLHAMISSVDRLSKASDEFTSKVLTPPGAE